MKIEDFVNLYNSQKTNEDKQGFVQKHIVTNRVSYADKVNRANIIAKYKYYQKIVDKDGSEREIFHQNSAASHMLFYLTIVDLYTDIDIDYKMSLEQFEMLDGEMLDMIIDTINDRELEEFRMLVTFACDDIVANEYEPHAFIRNQVERFAALFGGIISTVIENIDIEKVEEVINSVISK